MCRDLVARPARGSLRLVNITSMTVNFETPSESNIPANVFARMGQLESLTITAGHSTGKMKLQIANGAF